MKITKEELKKVIKEEIEKLEEIQPGFDPYNPDPRFTSPKNLPKKRDQLTKMKQSIVGTLRGVSEEIENTKIISIDILKKLEEKIKEIKEIIGN